MIATLWHHVGRHQGHCGTCKLRLSLNLPITSKSSVLLKCLPRPSVVQGMSPVSFVLYTAPTHHDSVKLSPEIFESSVTWSLTLMEPERTSHSFYNRYNCNSNTTATPNLSELSRPTFSISAARDWQCLAVIIKPGWPQLAVMFALLQQFAGWQVLCTKDVSKHWSVDVWQFRFISGWASFHRHTFILQMFFFNV